MADAKTAPKPPANDVVAQVVDRVKSGENILVALSNNPSVDELSAAIGLTMMLDKMGKHATAIFSGAVPNALEFLQPQNTFETNTNSLQDFIIALDKEKADHLRYKIEGDYVKVFITPYRTTIDEGDLEFSHGDYNVDLVVSLNVGAASDLDGALSEHGRIMHDASSINISIGVPGKFGDLEWNDPSSSSVSEMMMTLADKLGDKIESTIDKPVATAFLTGIVAATNRFSNERTAPSTMIMASKLMELGADQQLISSNIPVDMAQLAADAVAKNEDGTMVVQDGEQSSAEPAQAPEAKDSLNINHGPEEEPEAVPAPEPTPEPTPEPEAEPIAVGAVDFTPSLQVQKPEQELEKIIQPTGSVAGGPLMDELRQAAEAEDPGELGNENGEQKKDYASLMEQELNTPIGADNPAAQSAPEVPTGPEINGVPPINYAQVPDDVPTVVAPMAADNAAYINTQPETVVAPVGDMVTQVAEPVPQPQVQIPEPTPVSAPLPMPSEAVLPPPPPPFDPSAVSATPPVIEAPVMPEPVAQPAVVETQPQVVAEPVMPTVQPIAPAAPVEPTHTYLGSNPAMPDQVYPPQDPGAFQLPS